MREEFEKLVVAGKISHRHVEPLLRLTPGSFCLHRSWGFGRIAGIDTVMGRMTIDFQAKAGHSLDLAFAAESLQPIEPDHILARKATDLEGLRQMAVVNQLDLVKLVVRSYGGRCTPEQIQKALVPDVIATDWKKWWDVARREMKKDGHFVVPSKKTDPIVFEETETLPEDRLLNEFRAAKGLKARLAVVAALLKNLADLPRAASLAPEILSTLNADIQSHHTTMPALALEAIFARDELAAALQLPPAEGQLTPQAIWSQKPALAPLLEQLPAARHKKALESFRQAHLDTWADAVLAAMNRASARLCSELANALIQDQRFEALKRHLARLISQHTASSELLLWLAKERSDAYADVLGPEVFRAMLTAIERDQFSERKSNRLRDYILDDQQLIVELFESADIELIKDLTRALKLSPAFDDMDKRSLLARIVKAFPATQSLITGEQSKQDHSLIVSWKSLERRKQEYTELVEKRIPANSKEIAIARSYGDLRENHEYKAAKEMHRLLMRRKAELENLLVRARGTDFANPRTDVVSIGTRVRVTDLASQQAETYTIAGAWDFDAEQHIISYLSPIAQALLNRKIGDEVNLDTEGGKKHYRIDAIEAWTPGGAPSPAHPEAPAGSNAAEEPEAPPTPAELPPTAPAPEPSAQITTAPAEGPVTVAAAEEPSPSLSDSPPPEPTPAPAAS
jgi:transcription elongation GreA/GreB family factor